MPDRISKLRVEGFRSIREQVLELHGINVLIGANGAGKSNLLGAIQMLRFIGTKGLGAFVGRRGGASALLFMGPRRTPVMTLEAEFAGDHGVSKYRAVLAHATGDALIFTHEEVGHRGLDEGAFRWTPLGSGHAESKLDLAARDGDATARTVQWHLRRIERYHFHDTSDEARIRNTCSVKDTQSLRPDAGNLAAWLYALSESHPERFERISGTIRQLAPYFGGFALTPSPHNDAYIMLNWTDRKTGHVFHPGALSDGTLRAMALVTMLLQPPDAMPLLVAVDEPELGLHPFAMNIIASLVQGVSSERQLVLSTQSTHLLDCFDPACVIVADRVDGATTFRRLDVEELGEWLSEYSMSALWEKNVLGGGPGR